MHLYFLWKNMICYSLQNRWPKLSKNDTFHITLSFVAFFANVQHIFRQFAEIENLLLSSVSSNQKSQQSWTTKNIFEKKFFNNTTHHNLWWDMMSLLLGTFSHFVKCWKMRFVNVVILQKLRKSAFITKNCYTLETWKSLLDFIVCNFFFAEFEGRWPSLRKLDLRSHSYFGSHFDHYWNAFTCDPDCLQM